MQASPLCHNCIRMPATCHMLTVTAVWLWLPEGLGSRGEKGIIRVWDLGVHRLPCRRPRGSLQVHWFKCGGTDEVWEGDGGGGKGSKASAFVMFPDS